MSRGASVGLSFRITAEGCEHLYEIRRVWSQSGRTLRERIHVSKDGQEDQFLAEHWVDLIEEVIPLGISQLFFFDAEKVRFLADDETGNGSLGGAIKALLGLDLAERLTTDASVLEARLVAKTTDGTQEPELGALSMAFEDNDKQLQLKKGERASLENHRLRAENEKTRADKAFAAIGGKHWEKRESQYRKLAELERRTTEMNSQLSRLAAGSMPLVLVPDLLSRVRLQDQREKEAAEQLVVHKLLLARDRRMLSALKKQNVATNAIEAIRKLQKADRASRQEAAEVVARLNLSEAARSSLIHLQTHALSEKLDEAQALLKEMTKVCRQTESTQRAVKAIPDKSDISEVMETLQQATKKVAVLNDRARRMDSEIESLQAERDRIDRKLQTHRREQIDRQIQTEEAVRMAQLTVRTQTTMKEFLRRATADKIDQLSARITDSFRFLLRKKTLVRQVQVDSVTFAITLFDDVGHAIPKHRLSEGEKQVFAISVLWGLAQASPRPLPSIIDTPMARLDSEHRQHLIERYFPNASHQVIILSTDTEVDQTFYRGLQRHITRAYHLDYDDKKKTTNAREGYFWPSEEPAKARHK